MPLLEKDIRGTHRKLRGFVTSTKMNKTVVVQVVRKVRDRQFHKSLLRRAKYNAHDERNEITVGDYVEIVESRPYSKTKRWRVFRTIEKVEEN